MLLTVFEATKVCNSVKTLTISMSENFEAFFQLPQTPTQLLPIGEAGQNKVNLFDEYQYPVPQAATVAPFQVYETDPANIGGDISLGASQYVTWDRLNPSLDDLHQFTFGMDLELGTHETQELPSTPWIPGPHCDRQAIQHPGSQSIT
jgi:hypothetical protein